MCSAVSRGKAPSTKMKRTIRRPNNGVPSRRWPGAAAAAGDVFERAEYFLADGDIDQFEAPDLPKEIDDLLVAA